MPNPRSFADLKDVAKHLRDELQTKKVVLLYAYNGTGKTRLSTEFKDLGKQRNADGDVTSQDTLYFNAFTEDLFSWDNDLNDDRDRYLKINTDSKFFEGLDEVELDNRIGRLLANYADFGFRIDVADWTVRFWRDVLRGEGADAKLERLEDIKISRSEESIFIWCFFLAVVEIAMDRSIEVYNWVKYIFIDDPISSLDEQNATLVAVHLAHLLMSVDADVKAAISTHHPLFHNVMWNELRQVSCKRYFLGVDQDKRQFTLQDTKDVPFFHHVAELIRLYGVGRDGTVEKRHFNSLRAIAERTASFHGYARFEHCIGAKEGKLKERLYRRFLNLYSHGGYAHFETDELQEDDKQHFSEILKIFLTRFNFNPEHFPELLQTQSNPN